MNFFTIDVLALAAAIKELTVKSRKARTAMWCALLSTIHYDAALEARISLDSNTAATLQKGEMFAQVLKEQKELKGDESDGIVGGKTNSEKNMQ